MIRIYESNYHQVYVALVKSVIWMKDYENGYHMGTGGLGLSQYNLRRDKVILVTAVQDIYKYY